MLSTVPLAEIVAVPALTMHASAVSSAPSGLSPAQVRHGYGFDQISLPSGQAGDGAGQTIAIIDAFDNPHIGADLATFDRTFGLADPPSFQVVKQKSGGRSPRTDSGWAGETALDVEWAHAIAPKANILLVEAFDSSVQSLIQAVDYARNQPNVTVVSMSWGTSEFGGEIYYDAHFTTPSAHRGITFVASSGDWGTPAIWPSASPNVLSVGGTYLRLSATGNAIETGWSGSGGGYSRFESEPSYQYSVQSSGARSTPDVAFAASPQSGFAVFDLAAHGGRSGWFEVGGTSAGAPQWAALIAVANQARLASGLSTLSNAPAAVYALASGDFHDITAGSNGFAAAAGYDLVTGRGSPLANRVARDLSGSAVSRYATIFYGMDYAALASLGIFGRPIARSALVADGADVPADIQLAIQTLVANLSNAAAPPAPATAPPIGLATAGIAGDMIAVAPIAHTGGSPLVESDEPAAAPRLEAPASTDNGSSQSAPPSRDEPTANSSLPWSSRSDETDWRATAADACFEDHSLLGDRVDDRVGGQPVGADDLSPADADAAPIGSPLLALSLVLAVVSDRGQRRASLRGVPLALPVRT